MKVRSPGRGCGCLVAPHSEAGRLDLYPDCIAERRRARFFGPGGLCSRLERVGDPLWQADEIARALADRVLGGYEAVIERFRFSVRAGTFGPPACAGRFAAPEMLSEDQRSRAKATRHLLALDSAVLRAPEPGQFAIRPSVLVASDLAPYMRARQSIWAHWIASQGWAVPAELAKSIALERPELAASPIETSPRKLPKPREYKTTMRAIIAAMSVLPPRERYSFAIYCQMVREKAADQAGVKVADLEKMRGWKEDTILNAHKVWRTESAES